MKTLLLLFLSSAAASAVTLTGTWSNTTFGSSGPLTFTYAINLPDPNFSVTLDLDGSVFGGLDPSPLNMSGVFSDPIAGHGSFGNSPDLHPTYGNAVGFITGFSSIAMDMNTIPNQGIFEVRISGTITPTSFDGTYRVNFNQQGQEGGVEGTDYAVGTLTAVPEAHTSVLALGALGLLALRRRR